MSIYRVTFSDGGRLHLAADNPSDAELRVGRVFRSEQFTVELETALPEVGPAEEEARISRSVHDQEPKWLC